MIARSRRTAAERDPNGFIIEGAMIIEVNNEGDIVVPAELVRAAPHTRLTADRQGDWLVLKPVADQRKRGSKRIVDSLPILTGRLANSAMTFRRKDIYGPDGR